MWRPNNPIEERVEDLIRENTGVEVEFSPEESTAAKIQPELKYPKVGVTF